MEAGSTALSVESSTTRAPCAAAAADEGLRAEDVVGDGGEGLLFQQRDVLEGGGVKDDARRMRGEDFVEQGAVGDAAEDEA